MARTLDLATLYRARYAYMQSIAWEKWCDDQGMSYDPYPPGVEPSAALAPGLQVMEETWYAEMPTATP